MEERFALAAFRSRQQVMRFDSALRRSGVATQIISTPKDIQVGCGLSVRFEVGDAKKDQVVYRRYNPGNLIRFYLFTRLPGESKGRITPLT
ncbi:MAG: DUF3343 domain-containing protein [Clostridia bacterium]|nr:DUF3343 domain-containing protein [Clostridia bacterium]